MHTGEIYLSLWLAKGIFLKLHRGVLCIVTQANPQPGKKNIRQALELFPGWNFFWVQTLKSTEKHYLHTVRTTIINQKVDAYSGWYLSIYQ